MKTATIPPIRVEPSFRQELVSVLEQGETLSEFVENAVRATVEKRRTQTEFIKRGIAAIETTKQEESGVAAHLVLERLTSRVAAARAAKTAKKR